jgi:hypothetical protein
MRRFLLVVVLTAPVAAFGQTPDMKPGLDAHDAKDYATCAKFFTDYAQTKSNTDAFYYAAECYALGGDKDAAFKMLDSKLARGFANPPLLEKDPDLASLRTDPRWPGVIERANANFDKRVAGSNRELAQLELDDQGDRSADNVDWSVLGKRDFQRRTRVRQIISAGGAHTARDFYAAALVMQHGDGADDYKMAHDLAMQAVALDPKNKGWRWLAAAAEDRYLQCIGKPQIWGTQFRRNGSTSAWTLDPIDENAVTDEERAKWNVPSLAESKRRLAETNSH